MKDVGLPLIASAVRCRERGRSGRVRLGSYAWAAHAPARPRPVAATADVRA